MRQLVPAPSRIQAEATPGNGIPATHDRVQQIGSRLAERVERTGHDRHPRRLAQGKGLVKIRILLADDHEVVRLGVRALLEAQPGWEVVAEARTGREAVALAEQLRPDVAVLAVALPDLNGLEATRRIRLALPETEVLVFTMHQSEQLLREALLAGARGYLLKSDDSERLIAAVAALAGHRPYFSAPVSQVLLDGFVRHSAAHEGVGRVLTGREQEVVQLLAEGRGNKEVADALAISVKTVETHRAAVMRKLGIGSLADLVRYAVRNYLVEP
jgi:DNA-binding NarL/FixJ family response regulator